jgi:sulfate transport system substrate-binding protein
MTQFRKSFAAVLLGLVAGVALADATLLNVSYDVARDFYKDYNPMFQKHWKAKTGEAVELKQSHAGSTKQVRAVADGLEADVVTMNQANDVEFLAEKGPGAPRTTPRNSRTTPRPTPRRWSSSSARATRRRSRTGPIWSQPGMQVILPHPKNTGNGRYSYLSAWGWALKQPGGNDQRRRSSSASC